MFDVGGRDLSAATGGVGARGVGDRGFGVHGVNVAVD